MSDEILREALEDYAVSVQEKFYRLVDLMDERSMENPVNQAVECLSMSLGSIIWEVVDVSEATSPEERYRIYDMVIEDIIKTTKNMILTLEHEHNVEKSGNITYIDPFNTGKVQCND
jgi:hypothetical protein